MKNEYSIIWTGCNTYAVIDESEEIVYFGSLSECENFKDALSGPACVQCGKSDKSVWLSKQHNQYICDDCHDQLP
jgi:hypothetical protein